jgi:hypothetical protein
MKRVLFCVLMAFALLAGTSATHSFGQSASHTPPSSFDFKTAALADLEDMGKKLLELAKAMPPDKFTWRPNGEGSRSVSEVYLLAATQYYHLPSEWGLLKAAGYEADGDQVTGNRAPTVPLEKLTTDKAQTINELFDAISYFGGISKTLTDADLQKPIRFLGHDTTPGASLLLLDNDVHEYLDQAILYAQMNGVVLSWMTEKQKEREERGHRTEVIKGKPQ